ncbi:MAG: GTA-gp10 family protein [Bacillota bacterium]
MPNPIRGEVPLQAGGQTHILRFTTNALVELEQTLGVPVSKLPERPGIREIRAMVWAGLLHRGPMTLEQVGAVIDEAGLQEAAQAVGEAMRLAFGKPGADSKNAPAEAAGPGTAS